MSFQESKEPFAKRFILMQMEWFHTIGKLSTISSSGWHRRKRNGTPREHAVSVAYMMQMACINSGSGTDTVDREMPYDHSECARNKYQRILVHGTMGHKSLLRIQWSLRKFAQSWWVVPTWSTAMEQASFPFNRHHVREMSRQSLNGALKSAAMIYQAGSLEYTKMQLWRMGPESTVCLYDGDSPSETVNRAWSYYTRHSIGHLPHWQFPS